MSRASVPSAPPRRGRGAPSASSRTPLPPAPPGADVPFDEEFRLPEDRQADRGSTDALLSALTAALSALNGGGGKIERQRALRESFGHARLGLGAAKALLLYVEIQDPLQLKVLHSTGLSQEQLEACRELRSGDGVSPSIIRNVIESREPAYIPNAQLSGSAQATASLAGGSHSVLCAPILEPLTGAVLAVLYFQNHGLARAFQPFHQNWLVSYATALSQGFGMHLASERRITALEADTARLRQGRDAPDLVGESEATRRLREILDETLIPEVVDRRGKPILILGPSGTGKDLVARYLHYYSSARRGRFIAHNCAGMQAGSMTRSTLFGHVRGAFTGATEPVNGLFRDADKGVLFLDEIGELPPDGQAELLRVIQDKQVTPLGSTRSFPVDTQVVLATNRDLEAEAKAGRFRSDLYYRIAVHVIRLEPLADPSRRRDIRPLLTHFLAAEERAAQKKTGGLTPEALRALLAYSWPGNVRELANVCTALVTYTRAGARIDVADIRSYCPSVLDPQSRRADAILVPDDPGLTLRDAQAIWEREFIRARIETCNENLTRAAQSLDMGYSTLMRKLMLERERTNLKDTNE